jgi:hypothetical protein
MRGANLEPSGSEAAWIAGLTAEAPDVVSCWKAFGWDAEGLARLREELHRRVHPGDAPRLLTQQERIGDELERVLRSLPDRLLRMPGGEEDWNVAQTFAHATAARRFLPTWASLDAAGRWPEHRPPVVTPSVPGRPDATRDELLGLLEKSRRALLAAAAAIEGHEVNRCRMEHRLIGELRCGDWLLFAGIHDLDHLEQLHRLGDGNVGIDSSGG